MKVEGGRGEVTGGWAAVGEGACGGWRWVDEGGGKRL